MSSKENNLIKTTLLFSIGNAGSKLLMLVIVPLYTYYVTVDQMGKFDIVNTYISLFAPLAGLTLYEGIYRWLLDDSYSASTVIKNGLFLSFISLLAFDIISFAILYIIKYEFIFEFILVVDSTAVYSISQFTTRGLRNNKIYAVQGIVYTVILILCNLIFVIWLKMQAKGLLISIAVAGVGTTIFLSVFQKIFSKYFFRGSIEKMLCKQLTKYSVPMVPNHIAWWLVSASNRLVINFSIGDEANGIYAISMKFPTLVNTLSNFFYQAWQEQAISEYSSKERDDYYTKIFNIYFKLLFSGIVVLLPITKFIILYFMDPSYHDAYKYTGILYLSGVFNAFAAFYGTGYLSSKKTAGAFTTTIAGAIINVVLTFLTIDFIGLYAAAIGNMLGNAVIWTVRIVETRKFFQIRINKRNMILLIIFTAISIIAVNYANLLTIIALEILFCGLFIVINKEIVLVAAEKFKSIGEFKK